MIFLILISFFRYKLTEAKAIKNCNEKTNDINPIDKEFRKVRRKLLDLVFPIDGYIENKKLLDCKIIGPANFYFFNGSNIFGSAFNKLDLVLCKDDAKIHNMISISNCQFVNCKFHRVTFFLSHSNVDEMFLDERIDWVTFSPAEIDNFKKG